MTDTLQAVVHERRVDITEAPEHILVSLELLVDSAADAVEVIHDFVYFGTGRQVLYKVEGYDPEAAALKLRLITDEPGQ